MVSFLPAYFPSFFLVGWRFSRVENVLLSFIDSWHLSSRVQREAGGVGQKRDAGYPPIECHPSSLVTDSLNGCRLIAIEWFNQVCHPLRPPSSPRPYLSATGGRQEITRQGVVYSQKGVRILNPQKNPWMFWIFRIFFRIFWIFSDFFRTFLGVRGFYK